MACCGRSKFAVTVFVLQTIFLVLFGFFAEYDYQFDAQSRWFYPMFQNVHVMMFIGFGFLMTFLKRYGYSALSINFLIAALVLQWYLLFQGLLELNEEHHWKIAINLQKLIAADFTSAAVLISFGAVIGKLSPLQLILMAFFEVAIFTVNEYIAVGYFQVTDIGGSMVVHVFGAYFGLTVSKVTYKYFHSGSSNEGSSYQSDISSMIGTIFLWLYWPSFNAAIATTPEQQARAVINTYLSLASCVLATFAVSSLTHHKGKFNMVHIQNATLAGGVAVGTAANLLIQPWGAVLIGCIAAVISTLGFEYLQPALDDKLGIHDSCGVNNLHGLPGIAAAIIGVVTVLFATESTYGSELPDVFSAMANGTASRTAAEQAAFQAATLGVTLGLALVGGLITGMLLRFIPGLDAPNESGLFVDETFFQTPDLESGQAENMKHEKLEEPNGERDSTRL